MPDRWRKHNPGSASGVLERGMASFQRWDSKFRENDFLAEPIKLAVNRLPADFCHPLLGRRHAEPDAKFVSQRRDAGGDELIEPDPKLEILQRVARHSQEVGPGEYLGLDAEPPDQSPPEGRVEHQHMLARGSLPGDDLTAKLPLPHGG